MKRVILSIISLFALFALVSATPKTSGNPTPIHNTIRIGNVHCNKNRKQMHAQPARHCIFMDPDALTYGLTDNLGYTVCKKTTKDDYGGTQGREVCQYHNEQQTEIKCFSDGSKSLRVSFDKAGSTVNEVRGGLKFFWQSDLSRNPTGKTVTSKKPGDNLYVHCNEYVKHHGNNPGNTTQTP